MNMHMLKITQHMKREPYFKKHYPDLYEQVIKCNGETFVEKLYNYINPDQIHTCNNCGKPTKFINFNKGYAKYCCPGCASKDPLVKSKKIHTVQSHYGVSNPSQSKLVQDKVRNTMLERYGDEHYNNREQAQQTNLIRYGVSNAMQNDDVKNRLASRNMERYGTKHTFSLPEVIQKSTDTLTSKYGGRGNASNELKERAAQTSVERYGDSHYNNREQAAQTNLDRYGDEHYNNRDLAKRTNIKRYGVEHASQSDNVKQKIAATVREKYGADCVFQNSKIQNQIKITNLDRYGVEYASQSEVVKDKMKTTSKARYGVEYPSQCQTIKDKVRTTLNKKLTESFPNLISCYYENGEKFYKMGCGDCQKCSLTEYNIRAIDASRRKSYGLEICPISNPFNPVSNTSIEQSIKQILDKHHIDYVENDRTILSGKEVDIFIPSHKLAIECNGIYWHSSKFHQNSYHQDKYNECANKGIQLITIWEDQIRMCPEKIESLLLSKLGIYTNRIYARLCDVREISRNDSKAFINAVHLQNDVNSSYRFGLYYNNELVSVMTFGKSRNCMSKCEAYELYRYATKPGYQIIGGASKLFSCFKKNVNPSIVISFSSNDISNGSLYDILGFEKSSQTIGYWYVKNNVRYHRYTFSKHRLVELGYDKSLSEFEIMDSLGYSRIYDSGQTKWVWSK